MRCAARRRPEVGQGHRCRPTGERGQGQREVGAGAGHDGDGRPQAGTGRHPEQEGVGQRVAEHALIRSAPTGQHGPHDPAEDHPGQADLIDDPVVERATWCTWRSGRWDPRSHSTVLTPRSAGPIDTPASTAPTRAQQATTRAGRELVASAPGGPGQVGVGLLGGAVGSPDDRGHDAAFEALLLATMSAWDTVRMSSTMRGPQREAMSSSSGTTWCFTTAVI